MLTATATNCSAAELVLQSFAHTSLVFVLMEPADGATHHVADVSVLCSRNCPPVVYTRRSCAFTFEVLQSPYQMSVVYDRTEPLCGSTQYDGLLALCSTTTPSPASTLTKSPLVGPVLQACAHTRRTFVPTVPPDVRTHHAEFCAL